MVTELNDYIENELHFEAYVDWKDSSSDHLDREHVTAGTANYLRTIMRHSCSLIFVVGENADLMTAPDQKNLGTFQKQFAKADQWNPTVFPVQQ
ncbi:MAG: hypothetical protein JNJ81_11355 [Candidatus Accumulibacter sp.]|nr:hypothetical protein [Accumulibacter sp.]